MTCTRYVHRCTHPSLSPCLSHQVAMCQHRMGMICASSGDHRSAVRLLEMSRSRYAQEIATHALAKEAEVGLAIAK